MDDFVAIKERIRDRVDLVDLVSEHTVLQRRGKRLLGLCPFHQEKTPSFNVDSEKQFFKCFGCNAGGDVFTFVQLRESVEFGEALRILADRAGVELSAPQGVSGEHHYGRADLAQANKWALEYFQRNLHDDTLGASTRAYLEERAIAPDMWEQFALGLATGSGNPVLAAGRSAGLAESLLVEAGLCRRSEQGSVYDTFRDRLMFPIRDVTGRCLGFGGRTLIGDKAKYMNTPQTAIFDKSKCLFGIDLSRVAIEQAGVAVMVEGYTDCIAAHQHGVEHVVATLGTAATENHLRQLRRYGQEVVLVFDSDEAGEAAADRAIAIGLKENLNVRLASVPGQKDPCDYLQLEGAKGFTNLLNSAPDALGFKWRRTRTAFEAGSAASRRDAVAEFVSLVADLVNYGAIDAIQQGLVLRQLADLLGVSTDGVRRLLADASRRMGRGKVDGGTNEDREESPRDSIQSAMVTMLEVLVNEPGLYDGVSDLFDPARFVNPAYGRVAACVRDLCEAVGEFSHSELQSRIEDAETSSVLADLAFHGTERGNFAVTLDGAAVRLRETDASREASRWTEEIKTGEAEGQPLSADDVRERLDRVSRHLAGRSGFAPPRATEEFGRAD